MPGSASLRSVEEAVGFEGAEELLLGAEFEDCRHLWYSSNYVFLAQMCGPGGQPFAAVYKPGAGESPLWDFPDGQLYRREAAAYRLARLLGWNFVPPTVVRDGPHGEGSVQVFVRHDHQSHFFTQREDPQLVPQLQRMAVFDFVANNADRKGGHCLLDAEGQIWGIDHGLCFHRQYKLRTVIWDWADESVPDQLMGDIEAAHDAILEESELARPLLDLLSERDAAALMDRMKRMMEWRRLPLPGPHRSYPWPLV